MTKKNSLSSCTKVFFTTMSLLCNHMIKTRMKEIKSELERILMRNISFH